MNTKLSALLLATLGMTSQVPVNACTGITLKSKDGAVVAARTIEWAESAMNSMYVVVPRNQHLQSLTPSGINGLKFKTKYGFVGLAVEQKALMKKDFLPDCSISRIMENINLMTRMTRTVLWRISN